MTHNSHFHLRQGEKSQQQYKRSLRMEALEERALLSVTPLGNHEDLATTYASFPISENSNFIDVTELTADNLRAAIEQASQTVENDVIVVHTTQTEKTIRLDGSALVFDVNSDQYGSITLVGYGDTMLTICNTQENVAIICSGDVYFGGISFLALEPVGQSFQTDNLVVVSDNANVAYARSMFAVEDAPDGVEAGSRFDSSNGPLAATSVSTHTYTINVNFSGSKWAFVAGLSETSYNQLLNWEFENYSGRYFITGDYIDAEKNYSETNPNISNNDSLLCWAGSAADILWYTGWANSNLTENGDILFNNVDDVFRYFAEHFTDGGGAAYDAYRWFLSGDYVRTVSGDNLAELKTLGGGFYEDIDVNEVRNEISWWSRNSSPTNWTTTNMLSSFEKLKSGYGVDLMIYTYNQNSNKFQSGHAITAWGYIYDTNSSSSDSYLVGLLVSDPDNDKKNEANSGIKAPNRLQWVDLEWNSSVDAYQLSDYSKNDVYYLGVITTLAPYENYASISYNSYDTARLRTFLEKTDSNGVKNGVKISGNSYSANDPSTWNGVMWTEINGEMRLSRINWDSCSLVGSLDLSGCTKLAYLTCFGNKLTSLNVSGCTALAELWCNSNQLTSINASGCSLLSQLFCPSNQLTSLNLSECTTLARLQCQNNQLTTLDISNCIALEYTWCWNSNLERININQETEHLRIYLNAGSNSTWTIRDSKGSTWGEASIGLDYYSSNSENLPITATNANGTQTIIISAATVQQLPAPTLTVSTTGSDSVSVYVGNVVNASGYSLQYSTNSSFTNATTRSISSGTTTINNLSANTTYYFRVKATGSGNYTDSDYSATKSTTTNKIKLATPTLTVSANGSDSISVTVGSVSNASGYTLQYATNSSFTSAQTRSVQAGSNTISGLTANTTYYFRVMATGSGNYSNSDYSATKSATTSANIVKLSTPTLSVNATGSDSISVTVGSVANASGYTLQYATNSNFTNATTRNVSAGSTTISGLSSNTTYYFRVMATGSASYTNSDYSETKSVFINSDYTINDVDQLRSFLEQTDSDGVKNGTKINSNYDPNDPSTWSGVTLKEIDGEMRVTRISWNYDQLVGDLDVSGCTALTYLSCSSNQLTSLNVSGCTGLLTLYCSSNQLTSLNVSENIALIYLSCSYNQLTALDISKNTELTEISCDSNQLTTLDVSKNTLLTALSCDSNQLTLLDVSKNTALISLDCGRNQLTSLDVSMNTVLTELSCCSNQLTSLDVSKNTALTELSCYSNQLTSLNVSKNIALTELSCFSNQLASLDVSKNTALLELSCGSNQLTSLDVSKNAVLTELSCSYNQFTTLDVSRCTQLTSLSCLNSNLNSIVINQSAESISISFDYSTWNFKDANGNNLEADGSSYTTTYTYKSNNAVALPITAIKGNGSQTISLIGASYESLAAPTLNVSTTGADSVSVTVGSVANASGYLLQYSTREDFPVNSSFYDTITQSVSTGTTTISGLSSNRTYYFRVMAIGTGNYCSSDYSETQSATTNVKLSTPTLRVGVITPNSVLVNVGSVWNASGYTLQYATNLNFTNATTLDVSTGSTTISGLSANTTYYFRVMAIGMGNYSNSDYSETKSVTTNSNSVSSDVGCIRTFLEQIDSDGVKNGAKINSDYDPNDTSTWTGVTWEEINGVMRVTSIYWWRKQLVGELDVSECTALTSLDCSSSRITSLDVSGCTALTSLTCYGNQLTSLDVSNNTALTTLHCMSNQLTSLDVSKNTALTSLLCSSNSLTELNLSNNTSLTWLVCNTNLLTSLDLSKNTALSHLECYSNQFTSLDLSHNAILSYLKCWNTNLGRVIINPEMENVDIGFSSGWTFKDANGNTLAADETSYSTTYVYKSSNGVTLPIIATNSSGTQTISIADSSIAVLPTPTLSANATGSKSVSVTVGNVANASGYTLQYATNSSFTNATTKSVSAGSTTINGLTPNSTYYFRVMAIGTDNYSNSDYSNVVSVTTDSGTDNVGDSLSTAKEIEFTNNIFTFTDKLGEGVYGLKDVDVYKLTVSNSDIGRSYSFTTSQPSGGTRVDTYIRLFNSSGSQLAYNDDGGDHLYSTLTWTPSATGTYYLGVSSCGNMSYDPTTAGSSTSNGYQGDYKLTVTRTGVNIQLATPTLSVSTMGTNSVSVTVGSVANASGYMLQYATNSTFTNATSRYVSSGTSTITGLSAGTMYYFRVMATGTGSYTNSDYSSTKTVTTNELGGLDISVNGKSVSVFWSYGSPVADSIRYRVTGTTRWTTQKLGEGVIGFSFNGKVGTNYDIEVLFDQRENNVLRGSAVVLDQAKLSAIKPSITDESFQINVSNYNTKNLAANAKQAILTVNGVRTVLNLTNQQGSTTLNNGGNVTFVNGLFTFTNMASNTQYKVQVSIANEASTSTVSSTLSVKTTKTSYQAPVITSAAAVNDSSIVVTWETAYGKKSNMPAQKYTVQYSLDGNKWTNATTVATGNLFIIQKLKGGNNYQVRVLATKDNMFEASTASSVLTAETLALPKVVLEKNSVTDDTFQVNVTNYMITNLRNATKLNVTTDKFGTASIEIQNRTGSGTFGNGVTVSFVNGTLTFMKVPSNTQMKLQVSFTKADCTTALSSALTVKTTRAMYNRPVLTSAVATSNTTITIEWEMVYGKNSTTPAQKYTVQYSTDGVHWTNVTTNALGTSFTIMKLKPNTQYLVAVLTTKDQWFNASLPSNSRLVKTPVN